MANNDWLKILARANSRKVDKIPPGYMTHEELCKHFGKDRSTISRKLPLFIESGALTVGHFKRVDRAGRLVELPHYKLKK